MVDSRDIDKLRPDVAAACREVVRRAKTIGIDIIITSTVRDDEYQLKLYQQGRTAKGNIVTNCQKPTFHWIKAGLAFDFCPVKISGSKKICLWGDMPKWQAVGKIGEEIGFEWGGSWRGFVDKPHLQWSDGGKYTGAMIRSGNMPPPLALKATGATHKLTYSIAFTDILTRQECDKIYSIVGQIGYKNHKIEQGGRLTITFTDIATLVECEKLADTVGAIGYTNHKITDSNGRECSDTDSGYVNYTVKKGDSFWSIAQKQLGNGVKAPTLARYNGLNTGSVIKIGQILKIPKN